ncbi:MAG: PIN domain-containing protein [Candidatus Delongbacteria bacterium]
MHRVVLDTNVIVSGLRSRGSASHEVLRRVADGSFALVLSVPLAIEYESVLKRDTGGLGFRAQDVDVVVDYLCSVAEHRSIWFLWRPILPDPKDDMLLELAVEAGCDTIITFNTRHFGLTARFGVRTVTPREFLTALRSST